METMSSHLPKLDEEKLKFVIELKENRKMLDDGNEEEFIASQTSVAADIIDLIRKEETVLYPTSLAMISEEEFKDMKSEDREIGFTFGKLETTNEAKKSVSQENTNISEHIVEEIIEKFRSDEQDFAEFWINKPGLFIYISYSAVKDENGKFKRFN